MRLQKYLAHAGICSRRKAEEHILNGFVQVNTYVVKELGTKVDPSKDKVLFKGQPVILKIATSKIYIALNKPVGVISSCSHQNAKIVLDLVKVDERIYPVGRLDKDSKGLLLLTNDGDLHNKLSHPSFNHEKEYIVTTREPVSDASLLSMARGIMIEKKKTRKAKVKRLSGSSFCITLKQGRNRQIRKMVAQTGNKVDMLKRVRIANINLGSLKKGQWRYLSPKEIKGLTG
ncbi:MAG: rRNA pseudouridine synthase [Desulfobacula sp.]|nr:rRNA pseudouridine synthase [Desulfobacula sp.]